MDDMTDPDVESVCLMWASQTGKTEVINNGVAYHIDQRPSPILVLQPTVEMAKAWSNDRLTPMVRDTDVLRGKIREAKSREGSNTILHKQFPGGHITMVGANAPAGLAMRPIRVVVCDEVDRYPISAGNEGDPIALAEKRTDTFWDAVLVKTSTPTIRRASRIEAEFDRSDQRYWYVPCHDCGKHQRLRWSGVRWPKNKPEEAYYQCGHCKAKWSDKQRVDAIWAGEWRAERAFKGRRGYHLNGLYSCFRAKKGFENRLHQFAVDFIEAKAKGMETLKTWTNTFLAETWDPPSERVETEPILERVEAYEAEVPAGVLVLVAGVDVQHDRLEAEIVGYGEGDESWGIEVTRIYGSTDSDEPWHQLDEWLLRPRRFKDGTALRPACVCIDSGARTKTVYSFVRPRQSRRVFAVKGSAVAGSPLAARPRKSGVQGVQLFLVGTDTAKDVVYGRLGVKVPGPRYCHFPKGRGYDSAYFNQLTAEKVEVRMVRGFQKRVYVKERDRNEALDYRCYALAALDILNPDYAALRKTLETNPQRDKSKANADISPANKGAQTPLRPFRRKNWATSY